MKKINKIARVNILPNVDDMTIFYAEGYRRAAEILTRSIMRPTRDENVLVYPTLFMWRHYLELRLKHIVVSACRLLGDPDPQEIWQDHGLESLWKQAKGVLAKAGVLLSKRDVGIIGKGLKTMTAIDPKSVAFRYAHDKKKRSSLGELGWIHIPNVETDRLHSRRNS